MPTNQQIMDAARRVYEALPGAKFDRSGVIELGKCVGDRVAWEDVPTEVKVPLIRTAITLGLVETEESESVASVKPDVNWRLHNADASKGWTFDGGKWIPDWEEAPTAKVPTIENPTRQPRLPPPHREEWKGREMRDPPKPATRPEAPVVPDQVTGPATVGTVPPDVTEGEE